MGQGMCACQQAQVLQYACCDLNVSDRKSQIVNMGNNMSIGY